MNNENQNNEIFFDAKSGISEEEQREILEKINGITEKNKRALSNGNLDSEEKSNRFKAKKKGQLFPILVNAIALACLAAGLLVLTLMQRRTDVEAREGTIIYNSAERALIEEIRKDARLRLADKESEISQINLQLTDIDSSLRELYSNNEVLNSEQLALENQLKNQQNEYSEALANLLDERAVILEEFRIREALLQEQLESRAKELAIIREDSTAAVEKARSELDSLSKEHSQSQSVEAQLTAFFANINNKIIDSHLDDALKTIQSARDFLNTPSFQSLRSIETRKGLYNQTLSSYEAIITELNRIATFSDADSYRNIDRSITQLSERNTQLAKELAEKETAISAINQQGADAARRLEELNTSNRDKDDEIRTLRANVNDRDNQIRTLRANVSERDTQIRNLNQGAQNVTALQSQITALNNTISGNETTIASLRTENNSKDEEITRLERRITDIQNALRALQSDE